MLVDRSRSHANLSGLNAPTPRHSGAHGDANTLHPDAHSLSVPQTTALATGGGKRVGFKLSFIRSPKASRTYEVQPVFEPRKPGHSDNINEKSPLAPDSPSADDHVGGDLLDEENKRPSFHIAPRKRGHDHGGHQEDVDYFDDVSEPPSPTASSTEAGHGTDPNVFTFSPRDWKNELEKNETAVVDEEAGKPKNGDIFTSDHASAPTFTFGSTPPNAPAPIDRQQSTQANGSPMAPDSTTKNMISKFADLDKRKVRKMHSAVKLNRVSDFFKKLVLRLIWRNYYRRFKKGLPIAN